jgi:predicted RNase H-like nuclease
VCAKTSLGQTTSAAAARIRLSMYGTSEHPGRRTGPRTIPCETLLGSRTVEGDTMSIAVSLSGATVNDDAIVQRATIEAQLAIGPTVITSQVSFVNGVADFPDWMSGFGELAFCARRPGEAAPSNQIWRSGLVTSSNLANLTGLAVLGPDSFASLLSQPDPMAVSARDITDSLVLPMVQGNGHITSATVTVPNTQVLQVTGDGDYQRDVDGVEVFSVHFDYDVTLALEPSNNPFSIVDFLTATLVSVDVRSSSEGPLPWLTNFVADLVITAMQGWITSQIQPTLENDVNRIVLEVLNDQNAPQDTSITIESVTLDPVDQQVNFTVWATVPETVVFGECVGGVGSHGKRRPREQQEHLRAIRDALLLNSPEGAAYVETLSNLSPELVTLLRNDQALMSMVDDAVQRILLDFPTGAPQDGQLRPETGTAVRQVLQHLQRVASPRVALVAEALEPEVDRFVNRLAVEVLNSNRSA